MQEKDKAGESSMAQRGKGTERQCMVRRTGKHSKKRSKGKGYQENIQNPKRSMAEHKNRESRHA